MNMSMNTNGIVAQTEAALRRGGLPLSRLSGEPGALAVSRGFSVTTYRGEICVTYREGYDAHEPELFCEETTLARLASARHALETRGFNVSLLAAELVLIVHGGEEAAAWDWYRAARVEATARGAMKFYGSKPEVQ